MKNDTSENSKEAEQKIENENNNELESFDLIFPHVPDSIPAIKRSYKISRVFVDKNKNIKACAENKKINDPYSDTNCHFFNNYYHANDNFVIGSKKNNTKKNFLILTACKLRKIMRLESFEYELKALNDNNEEPLSEGSSATILPNTNVRFNAFLKLLANKLVGKESPEKS